MSRRVIRRWIGTGDTGANAVEYGLIIAAIAAVVAVDDLRARRRHQGPVHQHLRRLARRRPTIPAAATLTPVPREHERRALTRTQRPSRRGSDTDRPRALSPARWRRRTHGRRFARRRSDSRHRPLLAPPSRSRDPRRHAPSPRPGAAGRSPPCPDTWVSHAVARRDALRLAASASAASTPLARVPRRHDVARAADALRSSRCTVARCAPAPGRSSLGALGLGITAQERSQQLTFILAPLVGWWAERLWREGRLPRWWLVLPARGGVERTSTAAGCCCRWRSSSAAVARVLDSGLARPRVVRRLLLARRRRSLRRPACPRRASSQHTRGRCASASSTSHDRRVAARHASADWTVVPTRSCAGITVVCAGPAAWSARAVASSCSCSRGSGSDSSPGATSTPAVLDPRARSLTGYSGACARRADPSPAGERPAVVPARLASRRWASSLELVLRRHCSTRGRPRRPAAACWRRCATNPEPQRVLNDYNISGPLLWFGGRAAARARRHRRPSRPLRRRLHRPRTTRCSTPRARMGVAVRGAEPTTALLREHRAPLAGVLVAQNATGSRWPGRALGPAAAPGRERVDLGLSRVSARRAAPALGEPVARAQPRAAAMRSGDVGCVPNHRCSSGGGRSGARLVTASERCMAATVPASRARSRQCWSARRSIRRDTAFCTGAPTSPAQPPSARSRAATAGSDGAVHRREIEQPRPRQQRPPRQRPRPRRRQRPRSVPVRTSCATTWPSSCATTAYASSSRPRSTRVSCTTMRRVGPRPET